MTAAGLAVAIPAVLGYNVFGRLIGRIEADLEGFARDLRETAQLARRSPRLGGAQQRRWRWLSAGSNAPQGPQPMSDINMTPLVDVMLVLVVIFIITAPLLASSIRLDLPRTDAAKPSDAPQFVTVALDRRGRTFLDEQAGRRPAELAAAAGRRRRSATPRPEVQLRADQAVPYGRVVEVMGAAQKAGSEPHRLRGRSGRAGAVSAPVKSPARPGPSLRQPHLCKKNTTRRGRARRAGRTGPRATPTASTEDAAQEEVLRLLDAALSLRQAAHGPCAQLHHRRRARRASCACRATNVLHADGLGRLRPAGRERRDGEQACRRRKWTYDNIAYMKQQMQSLGFAIDWCARTRHLRARLLPVEPVAVPAHAGKGHRLQEDRRRQLGPGGPDRARQRAGDRRPRLAHRRAGREARDPDVLPADHRLRRGAARRARQAARLARARASRCRRTGSARARACASPSRTTSATATAS